MEDALLKMQAALSEVNFRDAPQRRPTANKSSAAERLAKLKELKDAGLLTDREYEEKRREILDSL